MPAPTTPTQPPKLKEEKLHENMPERLNGTSQELTGGAIRSIEFRKGQIELQITNRPLHTGANPLTSETIAGAATKALKEAGIKFTTEQGYASFITKIKIEASNLDIIKVATTALEGIAKHVEGKLDAKLKSFPTDFQKQNFMTTVKDPPDRFRTEAESIAANEKVRDFVTHPDARTKVSKQTLESIEGKQPSPVANKFDAVRTLERVTGMKPVEAMGGYSYEVRGEQAARMLVETLTTRGGRLPSGITGIEESDITLRRRAQSVFVEVKKDAITHDVLNTVNRLPIGPQTMERAAAEIKGAETPAAGRRF